MTFPDVHEQRAATRLVRLPFMTATRLRSLLRCGAPSDVSAMIAGDETSTSEVLDALLDRSPLTARHTTLRHAWRNALVNDDTPRLNDIDVRLLGWDGYPAELANDPAAPAVLFTRGDTAALNARRVSIVGTRNATEHGRRTARRFGAELGEAGVTVISGLARGVDAAAHRGVLETSGSPVGVVASGLDVVYPPEHVDLWDAVATRGFLCSEAAPGTAPEAFRFPMRNRIIAALSEVVIVVESRLEGGSLITVREALQRGVTVMAVPGSTGTRSAEGTNMLIRDGAHVALDADDVLTVLGMVNDRQRLDFDPRPQPTGVDGRVLELLGTTPSTLDDVATAARDRWGLSLSDTAVALGRLESLGWVMCTSGWFERR